MIDVFDIFEVYVDVDLRNTTGQENEANRRISNASERLSQLENRYERMKLVTVALWQLLKANTGLTDADLKQYIEKVDIADGRLDGKINRKSGAMDCPQCSRRILKSAVTCPWCSTRLGTGNAFEAT